MKLTKTNKVVIIIIAALILLSAVCSVIIHYLGNAEPDRLSETEIASRREQFPVIPSPSHPTIDFIHPTLEQLIDDCFAFADKNVYGNVVYGIVVDITSDDPSKISLTYPSHQCTIQVKECIGDLFEEGDTVTVHLSQVFWSSEQLLSEGMSIVFPVFYDENARHTYSAYFTGTYYVTDDGYVLSLYDEEIFSEKKFSGLSLEDFMNEMELLLANAQKKAGRTA